VRTIEPDEPAPEDLFGSHWDAVGHTPAGSDAGSEA